MRRIVFTAVAVGACGCALLTGASLYENGPGASPGDLDGGPSDAPGDLDRGPSDAQSDARFCAAHLDAFLCADFEGDGDIAAGWDKLRGMVVRAGDVAPHESYALAKTSASPSCEYDELERSANFPVQQVHLELDLRVSSSIVFSLGQGTHAQECLYKFDVGQRSIVLQRPRNGGGTENYFYGVDPMPLPDQWSHVDLDVVAQDGGPKLTMKVGGKVALDVGPDQKPELHNWRARMGVAPRGGSSAATRRGAPRRRSPRSRPRR